MRFCPTCRSEYRPGFDWCPDCNIALVDALAPVTSPHQGGDSTSQHDDETLVTVGTFSHPIMASLLASQLEAEGLEVFIDNAEMLTMDPLLAPALGGVKVSVRASDAEMGRDIARRPSEKPLEDLEESAVPCPRCTSYRTLRERFSSRMAFLTILLLGFPWPFRKKGWKCLDCGNAWKGKTPDPSGSVP